MTLRTTAPLLLLLAIVGCSPEVSTTIDSETIDAASSTPLTETADGQGEQVTIEFLGELFSLQYQSTEENEIVNEYVPVDEDVEGNWTRMLAVREYPALSNAEEALGNLVRTVGSTYPEAPVEIFTNESTGQSIVEFTLTGNTETSLFVEYNLFRYEPSPSGSGVVSYQYAVRAYGEDTDAFLSSLTEERGDRLEAISTYDFPPVVR